ncbi:hypothetical protein VPH35_020070 [Triticum aestivum]
MSAAATALTASVRSGRPVMFPRRASAPPLWPSFSFGLLGPISDNVAFVRIRSTTSVCLLHGLVLLPCVISVAGDDDTIADDATELKWELDEDCVCCVVSFLVDQ